MPNDDLAKLESVYRALAESVRHLVDATIRTQVDAATITAVKAKIDCATKELSTALLPGSFGVQQTGDGQTLAWGNVMIGLRNPVAPPLVIQHDQAADFVAALPDALNAAKEN